MIRSLLCAGIALAFQAQEAPPTGIRLQTSNGEIIGRGGRFSGELGETPKTVYEGIGNGVVTLIDTGRGLTFTARKMTCTLGRDAQGNNYIETANLDGDAHVTLDSTLAAKTAAERAKAAKQTPPTASTEKSITTLVSDQMVYKGTPEGGTLTMPKPLTSDTTADGIRLQKKEGIPTPIPIPYHQVTHEEGTKGTASFAIVTQNGQSQYQPKKVHIDGRVTLHLVRTETPSAAPDGTPSSPTSRTFEGKGDQFDGDFEKDQPTMTLAGNVTLTGKTTGMNGDVVGDRAILFLSGETLQPARYQLLGGADGPTETHVKTTDTPAQPSAPAANSPGKKKRGKP